MCNAYFKNDIRHTCYSLEPVSQGGLTTGPHEGHCSAPHMHVLVCIRSHVRQSIASCSSGPLICTDWSVGHGFAHFGSRRLLLKGKGSEAKNFCAPKIDLKFAGPSIEVMFCRRKIFLMCGWVDGLVGRGWPEPQTTPRVGVLK